MNELAVIKEGRALANDLAAYLVTSGMMSWVEVPLGSGGMERADVFAMAKSFQSKRMIIYEIKVSRSDFLSDVNRGKYTKYKKHCHQLYFACPKGMVKKNEIPEGCGLITRNDSGWRVAKAAPRNDFTPSTDLMIRLLLRGYENHFQEYRTLEAERIKESAALKDIARITGSKIAYQLMDANGVVEKAEDLIKECEESLGETLRNHGLTHAIWKLEQKVKILSAQKKYMEEAVELSSIVMSLFKGNIHTYENLSGRLRKVADKLDDHNR